MQVMQLAVFESEETRILERAINPYRIAYPDLESGDENVERKALKALGRRREPLNRRQLELGLAGLLNLRNYLQAEAEESYWDGCSGALVERMTEARREQLDNLLPAIPIVSAALERIPKFTPSKYEDY